MKVTNEKESLTPKHYGPRVLKWVDSNSHRAFFVRNWQNITPSEEWIKTFDLQMERLLGGEKTTLEDPINENFLAGEKSLVLLRECITKAAKNLEQELGDFGEIAGVIRVDQQHLWFNLGHFQLWEVDRTTQSPTLPIFLQNNFLDSQWLLPRQAIGLKSHSHLNVGRIPKAISTVVIRYGLLSAIPELAPEALSTTSQYLFECYLDLTSSVI